MNDDASTVSTRLHEGPLRLQNWLGAAPPECGAQAIFTGTVRNVHEGRAVRGIRYHAYAPLAEKRLREIEDEARRRYGVHIALAHAIGELAVGDISVIVLVYGGHRDETFSACRWAIDTLKQTVPIWKEERYVEGESRFLDGTPLRDVSAAP